MRGGCDLARAIADGFDPAATAREARRSATIVIPLVNVLTARVRETDEPATRFVHWGATSQDAIDTAMALLLSRAQPVLMRDHLRLERSLRALSERHLKPSCLRARCCKRRRPRRSDTAPTTFGYKAAVWYRAVHRSGKRLQSPFSEALTLQFGGAAGTLAAYGDNGILLAQELGKELGIAVADAQWHTSRDRLAALATHCGIYAGALGKMARDIALLMLIAGKTGRETVHAMLADARREAIDSARPLREILLAELISTAC